MVVGKNQLIVALEGGAVWVAGRKVLPVGTTQDMFATVEVVGMRGGRDQVPPGGVTQMLRPSMMSRLSQFPWMVGFQLTSSVMVMSFRFLSTAVQVSVWPTL